MLFQQFFHITMYIKVVGKMLDQDLNVSLFSNPVDKVLKRRNTTGQICPLLWTTIRTLSPGLENYNTVKCWSGIFPQCMWLCFKIAGTTCECMVVLQSRGEDYNSIKIWWSQDLRVQHIEKWTGGSLYKFSKFRERALFKEETILLKSFTVYTHNVKFTIKCLLLLAFWNNFMATDFWNGQQIVIFQGRIWSVLAVSFRERIWMGCMQSTSQLLVNLEW